MSDDVLRLPTLNEFLENKQLGNSHVACEGFDTLYVRKNPIAVALDGKLYRCQNVVTLARVEATHPGKGAFRALIKDLVDGGYAVYVECVLVPWLGEKLLEWGFTQVNKGSGNHYLFNHEQHLTLWRH